MFFNLFNYKNYKEINIKQIKVIVCIIHIIDSYFVAVHQNNLGVICDCIWTLKSTSFPTVHNRSDTTLNSQFDFLKMILILLKFFHEYLLDLNALMISNKE